MHFQQQLCVHEHSEILQFLLLMLLIYLGTPGRVRKVVPDAVIAH
jgi:hypothetical protein